MLNREIIDAIFQIWHDEVSMWRYDDLLIVTEVIKQGSFICAAKKLKIPASTISRRVNELESALSIRLLERNSRKIKLTEKGEQLFVSCQPRLQEIKEAINALTCDLTNPKGDLSLTAPINLGNDLLSEWCCEFTEQYPDINLALSLSNDIEDLLDSEFDLAIRVGPLKDSDLIAQRLFVSEDIFCISPNLLSQIELSNLSIELIKEVDFLSYTKHKNYIDVKHKLDLENRKVAVNNRLSSTSTAVLRQAAIRGLGIACLPQISIEKQLLSGELVHILNDFCGSTGRDVYAVYPSKGYLSKAMQVFLSFIKSKANMVN